MGDAPQHAAHGMPKPYLNDFVPGGDHAHLAAAIGKKFGFRSPLEWCCAVALGMMFVYWAFKTVYNAPKSLPPQYRRYDNQEYRRSVVEEMGRQRQLRQRKGGECASALFARAVHLLPCLDRGCDITHPESLWRSNFIIVAAGHR